MKNIYILTLILFVISCGNEKVIKKEVQFHYGSLTNSDGRDSLDFIIEIKYNRYGNKIERLISKDSTIYKYDLNDNLINKVRYDGSSRFRDSTVYKYDINNKLLLKLRYEFNYGQKLTWFQEVFIYDDNNNLKETLEFNRLTSTRFYYKYDSNNKLIEKKEVEPIKDPTISKGKNTYKYDQNNNLIEEMWFHDNLFLIDSLSTLIVYSYDSKNKLIEEILYKYIERSGFGDDYKEEFIGKNQLRKHIYKYNSYNHIIEEIVYYNHIPPSKILYEYEYY